LKTILINISLPFPTKIPPKRSFNLAKAIEIFSDL
jgi:hypothetical protein